MQLGGCKISLPYQLSFIKFQVLPPSFQSAYRFPFGPFCSFFTRCEMVSPLQFWSTSSVFSKSIGSCFQQISLSCLNPRFFVVEQIGLILTYTFFGLIFCGWQK